MRLYHLNTSQQKNADTYLESLQIYTEGIWQLQAFIDCQFFHSTSNKTISELTPTAKIHRH